MKVKSESEVTQSDTTLCDTMDCSLSGSSVHGILQARVLEWVAITYSTQCIHLNNSVLTQPPAASTTAPSSRNHAILMRELSKASTSTLNKE